MKYKFDVGQKVMVKFNSKWTSGMVEMISRKGKDVFYHIYIEGAKHLKKVTENEIW